MLRLTAITVLINVGLCLFLYGENPIFGKQKEKQIILETYYVSPKGTRKGSGSRVSPLSLKKANNIAKPGDEFILEDGKYTTPIAPKASGLKGKPIVYRAAHPKKPLFAKMNTAVNLNHRSYIIINGITVKDAIQFIEALHSHHITITGCHFEEAEAFKVCYFYSPGGHIRVTDSYFKGGGDSLWIGMGNYHLVEDNIFESARHSCLTIMGIQRSIIRGNKFSNSLQKLMVVFSMSGGPPLRFNDPDPKNAVGRLTRYVVIEDNIFGPGPFINNNDGTASPGIHYAGNKSVIRRNVFTKCGIGLYYTAYTLDAPEALHTRSNRFYNNTVYDCGWPSEYASGPGIVLREGKLDFGDLIVVNNIFFKNSAHPDTSYPEGIPPEVQVAFLEQARPSDSRFYYNNLFSERSGHPVFWDNKVKKGYTVQEFEEKYQKWASQNFSLDPLFIDEAGDDFHLKKYSPCIDSGGPLTRTTKAGKGRVIEVEDALFFSDGFGIVEPDIIRIGIKHVAISNVLYESNSITVSQDMEWEQGTPVFLDFKGKTPDIGAFEHE